MWRTRRERTRSADQRLKLAKTLWGWQAHPGQRTWFRSGAQIRVAACGRRWGKTEALAIDLATLALEEARAGRDCRQLVVAPTEAQARLIGLETLARLREVLEEGEPKEPLSGASASPSPKRRGSKETAKETAKPPASPVGISLLSSPFRGGNRACPDGGVLSSPCSEGELEGVPAVVPKIPAQAGKDAETPPNGPPGGKTPEKGLKTRKTGIRGAANTGEIAALVQTVRERPWIQIDIHPPGVTPQRGNHKKWRGRGPAISRIIFRTAGRDGRGLRGLWAHRIVVDEAAYVPDTVLSEVLLPMLTDVGGELTLASTPAGRRGVFYQLFARGESHKNGESGEKLKGRPRADNVSYAAFQCPSSANPHLDRAFLRAMTDELGETRCAQEYGAEFVEDFGAVFRDEDIDACLADDPAVSREGGDLVSAPIGGHWYAAEVDWARKRDYTVVCILDATTPPARLVALFRMQGMGWEAQAWTVARRIAPFHPQRVLADGNSIGDVVAEQLQKALRSLAEDGPNGIPQVERFLFGSESKTRLIDHLTMALSARALRYPDHPTLLAELRSFEYGPAAAGGRPRMAARGGGHDDTVIALALAWYAAPDGPPPAPSELLRLASSLGLFRDSSPFWED